MAIAWRPDYASCVSGEPGSGGGRSEWLGLQGGRGREVEAETKEARLGGWTADNPQGHHTTSKQQQATSARDCFIPGPLFSCGQSTLRHPNPLLTSPLTPCWLRPLPAPTRRHPPHLPPPAPAPPAPPCPPPEPDWPSRRRTCPAPPGSGWRLQQACTPAWGCLWGRGGLCTMCEYRGRSTSTPRQRTPMQGVLPASLPPHYARRTPAA